MSQFSMSSPTGVLAQDGPVGAQPADLPGRHIGLFSFLVLSASCGLAAGFLEVIAIVLRKRIFEANHFYWISRHFVWLIPLLDSLIFVVSGAVLWLVFGQGRGSGLLVRLLCTMTFLAPFWAAFPRIYSLAGVLVSAGFAWRLVPWIELRRALAFRLIKRSLPLAVGALAIMAVFVLGGDRLREFRQERMPLPASSAANVILIVLDTVGADHLSTYGYSRPTSPTLDELAQKGVRFANSRSTSSWTLPAHASMFTGKWPHEISAGWLTPLDSVDVTLAQFLASRGYATAGFVANTTYCGFDSGLARGFAVYRDFIFPRLTAFHLTALVDRIVDGLRSVEWFLESEWNVEVFAGPVQNIAWTFAENRKESTVVNDELLEWLRVRPQPDRPFFAFVNYYDAHAPYRLRPSAIHRFGQETRTRTDLDLIQDWVAFSELGPSDRQIDLMRTAYDDCVADLDEQLGELWDDLERVGVRDRTWVVVVSDHGESFGEPPGVFRHGNSLHRSQVNVPLVIIPPAGKGPHARVVTETVSVRDLSATIVDVLGLSAASPLPGETLARFWDGSLARASPSLERSNQVLSEVVPLDPRNPDPSQILDPRWPIAALATSDWTFIRREGDVFESLFNLRDDPRELNDVAGNAASQPTLKRMRKALSEWTVGPLTKDRFKP